MNRLTKINRLLLFIILLFGILYFGAPFLVPFFFGILLTLLMLPFSNFLEKLKVNRGIAAITSTLVLFIVIGAVLALFAYQMNSFVSQISDFRAELQSFINNLQEQIASMTNISLEEQSKYIKGKSDQFLDTIETRVTHFVGHLINSLFGLLLVLLYVILLLLFRGRIYDFIMMYVPKEKTENSKEIFHRISKVAYQYLWGRVQVMMILAVMYYIHFSIFGLPYIALLIIFGTLITIIPYLGPFVSGLLPILVAMIFFDSIEKVLLFTAIIITIQLIESYVLEPLIIGKEVKLNPLVVIIAVAAGGALWGIAGMVLFVPFFAIFQIISMRSKGLEPIGYLLGNTREKPGQNQNNS